MILLLFTLLASAPLTYADPCLPKTGTVSSLVKQFEGTVQPVTEKLLRPSHEDFVKAVNKIQCVYEGETSVVSYDDLLQEMQNFHSRRRVSLAPFHNDGGPDTDELLSIYIYTHDCYEQINALTENGREQEIQPYIDMVKTALNRLPPYRGMVMRGTNLTGISASHRPGALIQYRNFISTSKALRMPGKNYQMLIHSETGRYVAPYSAYPNEAEVLFPPGVTFKVQGKMHQTSRTLPELRAYPKGTPMVVNKWNTERYGKAPLLILREVVNYSGTPILLPKLPANSQNK